MVPVSHWGLASSQYKGFVSFIFINALPVLYKDQRLMERIILLSAADQPENQIYLLPSRSRSFTSNIMPFNFAAPGAVGDARATQESITVPRFAWKGGR